MKVREYDDVRGAYYCTYKCDWTGDTCNYDDLYWYGDAEVSIYTLRDFFSEEGEKRNLENYYDPEMEMDINEEDLDNHIEKYYERVYD